MRTTWTLAEANRTLPLVRRIVADIVRCGRELRELLEVVRERTSKVRALELELTQLMRELEQIGCYYKDWGFELGLIDFPAVIEGKPVFLCWRSDEPQIAHFHPRDEGFASRRPLAAEVAE